MYIRSINMDEDQKHKNNLMKKEIIIVNNFYEKR